MMEIIVKHFNQLTLEELYEIIKIRIGVFVVEQNCAYQDLDDADKNAYHVYLKEGNEYLAYLRVIDKGERLDEVSVGRVISLKRKQGLGRKLLKVGIEVAKEKFKAKAVKVGAQLYAKAFYEKVGFKQISNEYLEDGIPHIYMLYEEK